MAYTKVPSGVVLPLFWGDAQPAAAVPVTAAQRLILVGQALSNTGIATDPGSLGAAAAYWGGGSALYRMYKLAKAAYPMGQISGLGVADGDGTAREVTCTFVATTAAVAGTLRVRIGSEYVDVPLPAYATSEAATEHAAALAFDAAFPAVSEQMYKCKSAADAAVSTLVCRHKGTIGNQVRIACDEDVPLPTGWTVTIAQSVAGATDPALTISQLGAGTSWNKLAFALDGWYETIAAEMVSRWTYARMLRGHSFTAVRSATYDAAITDLTTSPRTCQYVSRMYLNTACRAPEFEVAAVLAAVCMQSDEADLGLKVGTLTLPGCQTEYVGSEYSAPERNMITYYGGITYGRSGGLIMIDRCVTTRYLDSLGTRDERAYDAPKMWLVDGLLADLQAWINTYYARVRLLADRDGRLPPNSTTASAIHDSIVTWYKGHEKLGHVNDTAAFDAALQVIPDLAHNRVDVVIPADVAANLEVFACLMTY